VLLAHVDRSELEQVVEQMLASGLDQQYSPAVEQMRRNVRAQAKRAKMQQQQQQQQATAVANGEPVRRSRKRREGKAEAFFAVLEVVGAILEIFAA
jgi:hypothetical protein